MHTLDSFSFRSYRLGGIMYFAKEDESGTSEQRDRPELTEEMIYEGLYALWAHDLPYEDPRQVVADVFCAMLKVAQLDRRQTP